VFVACATSCAADDPIELPTTTTTKEPTTTTIMTPTTTSTTTTTSTSTTTIAVEPHGVTTDAVPSRPAPTGDVPAPILEAIQSLWPESEWNRAITVARCESNYRLDAANPTSSARGVFQLLAPWTRDPGSGRTVWGWDYTDSGEKLSAAAGLGIAEDDARYGYGNIIVAHLIWSREGWSPWNASRSCWAGS